MRVLVFDTETTGIIPSSITKLELMPYIVQCSFLTYDMTSHEIVHSYDNIVRVPNRESSAGLFTCRHFGGLSTPGTGCQSAIMK